jgi:hypothetical protein
MLLTVAIETAPRLSLSVPELAVIGEGDSRFVYVVGRTMSPSASRCGPALGQGRVEIAGRACAGASGRHRGRRQAFRRHEGARWPARITPCRGKRGGGRAARCSSPTSRSNARLRGGARDPDRRDRPRRLPQPVGARISGRRSADRLGRDRYTGAAASVVESRITQVLEERLAGVEGLQTITSRSQDGQSNITIEFAPGRDVDTAANDVRDRVGGAAGSARGSAAAAGPQGRCRRIADHVPGLRQARLDPLQLSDYIDRNLVDRFSSIDGVARVFVGGEARPAMRVWLQPERLAAFKLTPATSRRRFAARMSSCRPGGSNPGAECDLAGRPAFRDARRNSRSSSSAGAGRLSRAAGRRRPVEEGPENPYSSFRLNGQQAVGLGIVRQSGANTLSVADAAKDDGREIRPSLPGHGP